MVVSLLPVVRLLGVLLVLLSIFMTLPVNLLLFSRAEDWHAFALSALICLFVGCALLLISKKQGVQLRLRQVFLLTVGAWTVIPVFASLPLLLSELHLSVTDAFFESISGITTTGSTIFVNVDALPDDIKLWRSITQWIGGIGIIGMAIAILPLLKVGGMRLFATESSEWSEKAVPRVDELAKKILLSYLTLTAACFLVYWSLGMDGFNAINHAFTTVSTGGYSTSNDSMAQFDSASILLVSTFFMALGAMPFFLFVRVLSGSTAPLIADQQVRFFVKVLLGSAALLTFFRVVANDAPLWATFVHALFNITSIVTTTGYASVDYSTWGPFVAAVFLFLTVVGGCSGSTAGGMKIFRFQLCMIMVKEQITRLLHPAAIIARKYNRQGISDQIIASAVAFSFVFFMTIALVTLLLSAMGLDLITSLTGAMTALANVGPGLGEIIGPAGNFAILPAAAKWVLMLAMLMGRLELLTIFVVASPTFWRN